MHQRDVIHDGRRLREQFADPGAASAVLPELAPRAEQLGAVAAAHEREAFALDERLRNRLTVQLDESGFVIEQFKLARPAGHEEVNDVFRARLEMRRTWRHRIGDGFGRRAEEVSFTEQGCERDAAQAEAALLEEPAAGDEFRVKAAVEMGLAVHIFKMTNDK